LAKFLGEETRESSAGKGSILYWAPEQMQRSQMSGVNLYPTTDYFSLALINLDLARGSRRINMVFWQPVEEDLSRMTHLSEGFKQKIRERTHEDPLKRTIGLEEATEAADKLEEIVDKNAAIRMSNKVDDIKMDEVPIEGQKLFTHSKKVDELLKGLYDKYKSKKMKFFNMDELVTEINNDRLLLKVASLVGEKAFEDSDNRNGFYIALDAEGLLVIDNAPWENGSFWYNYLNTTNKFLEKMRVTVPLMDISNLNYRALILSKKPKDLRNYILTYIKEIKTNQNEYDLSKLVEQSTETQLFGLDENVPSQIQPYNKGELTNAIKRTVLMLMI